MLEELAYKGADHDWCEAHFKPLPRFLCSIYDLNSLTVAQRQYREIREMQSATLPFDEWLPQRPAGVTPESYWQWIDALQDMARRLEQMFGIELLVGLSLDEQQERPQ